MVRTHARNSVLTNAPAVQPGPGGHCALRAAFFARPCCDGNAHAKVTARLRFPPAAEARKVACGCGIEARFTADIAFGGSRLPLRHH